MPIIKSTHEKEVRDENGLLVKRETTTDSTNIHKNEEGNYIKIYVDNLDRLPENLTLSAFRFLMQLAKYAGYADINDLEGGMLVKLDAVTKEAIMNTLNIKIRTFYDNLKNLVKCNLIRKIANGCYQLNPNFLGKGYFEYKANYKQGGIKDLRENWNSGFKEKTVVVNDNRYTKGMLIDEIERINERLKETNDWKIKQDLLLEKNSWLKEVKKISETEYTKFVEYAIQQNEEINKLKEIQEREISVLPDDTDGLRIIEEMEKKYPEEFKRLEEEMQTSIPDYILNEDDETLYADYT